MRYFFVGCGLMLCVFLSQKLSAQVVEPVISPTTTSCYYGETSSSANDCWVEVISRRSTDTYTNLYLYVDIDGCLISEYEVYEIPQFSTPVPVQMNVNDIMVVWDEDATHGEIPPDGDFSFTGIIVKDPNCPYIRVRTNDQDDILNWSVHRVVEAGTLTVNDTGLNEHDVILFPNGMSRILLYKDDDVADGECVSPDTQENKEFTYTICYKNESYHNLTNVKIVDYLPKNVYYPKGWEWIDSNLNVIPPDPNYDPNFHTYTWEIGTLAPDTDPNTPLTCVSLDVEVSEYAEPGEILHNVAELIGTYSIEDINGNIVTFETVLAIATEDTPVCCYGDPNIIFVDINADGYDTGSSWDNAYNTESGLQKALQRAWKSPCSEAFTIYVAKGTYLPGISEDDSFVLPDGTEIYGGFPTGGCDFANRNAKKYKTILSGLLSDRYIDTVVTMGYESLLDGVTITDGWDYNIYSPGLDFTINNCIVSNSINYGIYVSDANAAIKSCMVKNNGASGIFHESILSNLNVSNSWVMRNNNHGIRTEGTTPTIKNCIISESDLSEEGNNGISILNPAYSPVLHNNTISNNKSAGLFFTDDISCDPNSTPLDYPDIQNCIIYYNNSNGPQLSGIDADMAYYSCIQDCNDVNNNHNISSAPMFAYPADPAGTPDPNNYHLAYNSICKDIGNPNLVYTDQVDYDNEVRVAGAYVDLGADEVYSCDGNYTEEEFANENDWNADGIVNLEEFRFFADSWLTLDPGDPGWADPNYGDPNDTFDWNPACNLDDTGTSQYSIDMADLTVFVFDVPWLWQACWYENYNASISGEVTMMAASVTPLESVASVAALSLDTDAEATVNPYDRMSNSELAQIVSDIYYLQDCVAEKILQTHKGKDKKDLQDILDFFDEELAKIAESLQ